MHEVCLLVWGVATHGEDKSKLHGGWQRKGCMHGVYLELLVIAGLLVQENGRVVGLVEQVGAGVGC